MNAYAQAGESNRVLSTLRAMAAAGFAPRTREYNVAINACRRAKKKPWGAWEAPYAGSSVGPSARPYSGPYAAASGVDLVGSAVAGNGASSSAGMVTRLLDEMKEAGIKKDSFTISTAIMAYGGAGQVGASPSPLIFHHF